MDSVKVGHSIALLRKKYGMTQLELAEKLSVTDKAVSRWERGLGIPDTSLLVKLSIILDVDVETLLEGNVTTDHLGWKGILLLRYPYDISPCDLVYTKRIVYLQLCYFMLVGITDVLIVGDEKHLEMVNNRISQDGINFIRINYQAMDLSDFELKNIKDLNEAKLLNRSSGVMLISGFDLIYGKDFTKYLRRVMNNCNQPVQIKTFESQPTSIFFFPRGTLDGCGSSNKDLEYGSFCLERGVFYLPVRTPSDLMDAGCFLRILESHQNERFMDIQQIAALRHITKGKSK